MTDRFAASLATAVLCCAGYRLPLLCRFLGRRHDEAIHALGRYRNQEFARRHAS
jgi:hypothetical protein